MFNAAMVALALSAINSDPTIVDQCDLIEINHYHSTEDNREIFTQFIFWWWDRRNHRHQVMAWRLSTQMKGYSLKRDWVNRGYEVIWKENDRVRRVNSAMFTQTWTHFDPELLERNFLHKDRRIGLRK